MRTTAKINEYHETGNLSDLEAVWSDDDTEIWAPEQLPHISDCKTFNDVINEYIGQGTAGRDYIAVNAYLPRTAETTEWLQNLRSVILRTTGCATTAGFGPRYLHSTGQMHKGGPNSGLFIQIVADQQKDLEIPNEGLSFGILERAQALGDLARNSDMHESRMWFQISARSDRKKTGVLSEMQRAGRNSRSPLQFLCGPDKGKTQIT